MKIVSNHYKKDFFDKINTKLEHEISKNKRESGTKQSVVIITRISSNAALPSFEISNLNTSLISTLATR